MDELTRRTNAAADRFNASLSDRQRALLKAGVRDPLKIQLTPSQQRLASELGELIPEGLAPDQVERLGYQNTVEENREIFQESFQRGWRDADKQVNKLKWIGLGIGCCIAIIILLRC